MERSEQFEHLAFRDISKDTLKAIDKMRAEGSLPRMKIMYDGNEEILVAKITVTVAHNLGGRLFARLFLRKVDEFGLPVFTLLPIGGARFGDNSSRLKEGDESFKPATRDLKIAWPSIVIEVGVSESISQLRNEAHFWLTKSGGDTRIVILLSINKTTHPRVILIERWEATGIPTPTLCNTAPRVPELVHSILLKENVPYTSNSLVIPAEKVFDVLPGGVSAGDFQITCGELTDFSNIYWAGLR